MNESYDEISLRDLYLIVKRGIPLIIAVTVLCAAAALLFITLRPNSYEAQATVQVSPTPVRIQGAEDARNLILDPRYDINWETYQEIAQSQAVLEETAGRLGDDFGLSPAQVRGSGEVSRLAGQGNSNPLAVSHTVRHTDPEIASAVATAWAQATVEAVNANILAGFESVRTATQEQLQELQDRVADAAARWEEFQASDDSALVQARLDALAERIPATEARLEELEREIAGVEGARQTLAASRDQDAQVGGDNAQAALTLLGGREYLPAETIAELTALLQQGDPDADLVALIRQVELQRLTTELAGLLAQRDTAQTQLQQLREQAEELRQGRAGLTLENQRLEQQLNLARNAYGELADLAPVIDYIRQLAAVNNRVLDVASVPTDPVGPSPLLVGVLAALVGGMMALLFVFLRAAVAEPRPTPASEPMNASPAH